MHVYNRTFARIGVLILGISFLGCTAAQKTTIKNGGEAFLAAEKQCAPSASEVIAAIESGLPGWLEIIFKNAACVVASLKDYHPSTPEAAFRATIAVGLVNTTPPPPLVK